MDALVSVWYLAAVRPVENSNDIMAIWNPTISVLMYNR